MEYEDVIGRLEVLGNPAYAEGSQARFGINTAKAYGIAVPELRRLAKEIKRDHVLAQKLWESGVHEARILASMVDDPKAVTEEQMERWAKDLDSWDLCDHCCGNLFIKTQFAYRKAVEWSEREEEFVKRAGFALMAYLAVHDKKASDDDFLQFLPIIKRESVDGRNFVKKAVNWALRQIGKRNRNLNRAAIETAMDIKSIDSSSTRWVAADALRELTGTSVQKSLSR